MLRPSRLKEDGGQLPRDHHLLERRLVHPLRDRVGVPRDVDYPLPRGGLLHGHQDGGLHRAWHLRGGGDRRAAQEPGLREGGHQVQREARPR